MVPDGMSHESPQPADLASSNGMQRVLNLSKVSSTLDVIHKLAERDAPAGTVVIADEQTAGRGRFGRIWHSPPGSGIWMGFLARPKDGLGVGVLSLRVGLAIARALEDMAVSVQLKWPNDVVIGRRKLGGVLCEARWMRDRVRWIAVGIGLNLCGQLPHQVAAKAVSLEELLPGVSQAAVLDRLLPRLRTLSQSPILEDTELDEYGRRDWLTGKLLREPVAGRALGIDSRGALMVQANGGVERVVGGTVVTG